MQIIECPREPFQNSQNFISLDDKIYYLNQLINVGFDIIDIGNLISPLIITQTKDSLLVLDELNPTKKTKISLLVYVKSTFKNYVSNSRVDIISYPFSISEIFQNKNINKNLDESLRDIIYLQNINPKKELMIYISMAFGNPYNEEFSMEKLLFWINKLAEIGIKNIQLCDTINCLKLNQLTEIHQQIVLQFPEISFGLHLHSLYKSWFEKVDFAYNLGFNKFNSCILGFDGCPEFKENSIGNIPTEKLITFIYSNKIKHSLNVLAFETAYNTALKLFKNKNLKN